MKTKKIKQARKIKKVKKSKTPPKPTKLPKIEIIPTKLDRLLYLIFSLLGVRILKAEKHGKRVKIKWQLKKLLPFCTKALVLGILMFSSIGWIMGNFLNRGLAFWIALTVFFASPIVLFLWAKKNRNKDKKLFFKQDVYLKKAMRLPLTVLLGLVFILLGTFLSGYAWRIHSSMVYQKVKKEAIAAGYSFSQPTYDRNSLKSEKNGIFWLRKIDQDQVTKKIYDS